MPPFRVLTGPFDAARITVTVNSRFSKEISISNIRVYQQFALRFEITFVRGRILDVRIIFGLCYLDGIPLACTRIPQEYKSKTKALRRKVRLTINCCLRRALILLNALRPEAGLSDAASNRISRDRSLDRVRRVRKPSKKREKAQGNFLRWYGKQRHGGKSVVWISLETFLEKKVFTPRADKKAPAWRTVRRSRINELRGPISSGAIMGRFVLLALLTLFRADNTVTFITSW